MVRLSASSPSSSRRKAELALLGLLIRRRLLLVERLDVGVGDLDLVAVVLSSERHHVDADALVAASMLLDDLVLRDVDPPGDGGLETLDQELLSDVVLEGGGETRAGSGSGAAGW